MSSSSFWCAVLMAIVLGSLQSQVEISTLCTLGSYFPVSSRSDEGWKYASRSMADKSDTKAIP